jgi:type VI secretion system protein VasG
MIKINYKSLAGKLNEYTRNALEGAAGLCVSRTHYDLEVEHLIFKLTENSDGDLYQIFKQYGVSLSRVQKQITAALETMKTGNGNLPGLSPHLPRIIQDAWMLGSVDYGAAQVRSGFIFLALILSDEAHPIMRRLTEEFDKIPADELRKSLLSVVKNSCERIDPIIAGIQSESVNESAGTAAISGQKNLAKFTIDLTEQARCGKIDPIVGRDSEIRDAIDILIRRRKNNPMLIGEAGVGKTAIVEGMALRISTGDVPETLKNVSIRTLDLGALQAGAGIRGEFEGRLKGVISEVTSSPKPVILFIDEIHTLMGAGGQQGAGDAANLLKPILARGELRTIGATTRSEHKQFIAKDPALDRRFQTIEIDEPDIERAVRMIRAIVPRFEQHHSVRILEDAVHNAVTLSSRYITGRQLPDKAVDLIDTACARVALSMAATPPELEDCKRTIDHLDLEISRLNRENAAGDGSHDATIGELQQKRDQLDTEKKELEKRWQDEKTMVEEIRTLRLQAEKADDGGERNKLLVSIKEKAVALEKAQGDSPLVSVNVDGQTVAKVVSSWTGIPVGKMIRDEMQALLTIKSRLAERVVGQDHALEIIANRLRTSRYNLGNPDQPIGNFLLVGPSGVGKTETALALSEVLFGGEKNIITLNMSEFKEQHSSARLIGPPPGYAGFGRGGLLTEKVRHRPYSVVLLDEIEKGHYDVREFFQQVFDKGFLTDTEGQIANFRNCVIIMTANVGDETILDLCFEESEELGLIPKNPMPDNETISKALRPELLRYFSSSLLARMTIVPYYPLAESTLANIIKLKLDQIGKRLKENHKIGFEYSDDVIRQINLRCTEVQSGARNVNQIVSGAILPEISSRLIERLADGAHTELIRLETDDGGEFIFTLR